MNSTAVVLAFFGVFHFCTHSASIIKHTSNMLNGLCEPMYLVVQRLLKMYIIIHNMSADTTVA